MRGCEGEMELTTSDEARRSQKDSRRIELSLDGV